MTKQTEQTVLMWLSIIGLVCLLSYTFVHTGGLFARYIYPEYFGYAAAFGVEVLIAGLAWRYARATPTQKKKKLLWFALVIALAVSMFANITEGYFTRYGEHLTIANIGQIDWIQAFVGVAATGLISLLVFAISDIVGVDVHDIAKTKKAEQTEEPKPELPKPTPNIQAEQVDYSQPIFNLLNGGVSFGPTAMAEQVGCSKATASKWINEWRTRQPNGHER